MLGAIGGALGEGASAVGSGLESAAGAVGSGLESAAGSLLGGGGQAAGTGAAGTAAGAAPSLQKCFRQFAEQDQANTYERWQNPRSSFLILTTF